ncbi:MAG: hypothetical protein ACLGPL_05575, partial [Acidobacteriota bacterium]
RAIHESLLAASGAPADAPDQTESTDVEFFDADIELFGDDEPVLFTAEVDVPATGEPVSPPPREGEGDAESLRAEVLERMELETQQKQADDEEDLGDNVELF